MSQREFARATGLRQAFINDMCNGKTKQIPVENIVSICSELNIAIHELMVLEEFDSEEERK
ncbi:helix-turn-helix domain-containing protein [Paenibacillus hexagrammi]|uniref:helix-turn-helix domain-containing protein n=1 Tax=Paenibacillus hexagrammi TaxID=2908839 RepID=UPI003313006A